MTLHYGITNTWRLDNFCKMSKKDYTYDNGRSGANSVISRIDKFLVSQDIDVRGGRIEIVASVRKLLDHLPLIITIWGQHVVPNNPPCYFITSLLSEKKCKEEMLQAWAGDSPLPTNDRDWPTWLEVATARVMHGNARITRTKKCA